VPCCCPLSCRAWEAPLRISDATEVLPCLGRLPVLLGRCNGGRPQPHPQGLVALLLPSSGVQLGVVHGCFHHQVVCLGCCRHWCA